MNDIDIAVSKTLWVEYSVTAGYWKQKVTAPLRMPDIICGMKVVAFQYISHEIKWNSLSIVKLAL